MTTTDTATGLQLRSLVTSGGELQLSLADLPLTPPRAGEVTVEVRATPINPSDLGLLIGVADVASAVRSGTAERPVVTAKIPQSFNWDKTMSLDLRHALRTSKAKGKFRFVI